MNAIELNGITKRYEGFLLDNVSLVLPQGSIMGLVGENGAGKSTTIKLIMNAIQRDGGTIRVLGEDNTTRDFLDVKQDIGIVLDEAYYPEVLTPVQVGAVMKLTYKKWDDTTYQSNLKQLDIPLKKQFRDFSRGMKMKFAIAVALSHQPKLLILDEATAFADPDNEVRVQKALSALSKGKTVIMIAHRLSSIIGVDCIYVMQDGEIVESGTHNELIERNGIFARMWKNYSEAAEWKIAKEVTA